MKSQKLRRQQLDRFFEAFRPHSKGVWIKAIREILGMSMEDLARRMGVIKQTVDKLEKNEKEGRVNLNSLRRAADAMDCDLVYFFVPRTSFEETVRRQARRAAEAIVNRTDATMALEDQQTTLKARQQLIEDLASELIVKSDRSIWKVD